MPLSFLVQEKECHFNTRPMDNWVILEFDFFHLWCVKVNSNTNNKTQNLTSIWQMYLCPRVSNTQYFPPLCKIIGLQVRNYHILVTKLH